MQNSKDFNIKEPAPNPLVFVPDDTELNYDCQPLPPPKAQYKRKNEDIDDNEIGVTSDWNFVSPY